MKAISLGWGVQSFGLAAMSALGELPCVDVAIHADTTHEREATYRFAEKWTPWLEEHGVKVVTVRPNVAELTRTYDDPDKSFVEIPAYTGNDSVGVLTRHCTGDWKIAPIRRWLQGNRNRRPVEQWIGITVDEITRAKPSEVKYITHRWPFLDLRWRRSDVMAWLAKNGIETPPKSACYFCPYQNRASWHLVKESADWPKAVAADEFLRKKRPPFDLFLHSSRIPLAQVDLRSEQERGQMDLFDAECSGHCGL